MATYTPERRERILRSTARNYRHRANLCRDWFFRDTSRNIIKLPNDDFAGLVVGDQELAADILALLNNNLSENYNENKIIKLADSVGYILRQHRSEYDFDSFITIKTRQRLCQVLETVATEIINLKTKARIWLEDNCCLLYTSPSPRD